MSEPAYMSVVPEGHDKEIPGERGREGREGSIMVLESRHVIELDPHVHWPADARRHGAYRVRVLHDRSATLLFKALSDAQSLAVRIHHYAPDPSGTGLSIQNYRITLGAAHVVGLELVHPNALLPDTAPLPMSLWVDFAYQSIAWEYMVGNVSFEDVLPVR